MLCPKAEVVGTALVQATVFWADQQEQCSRVGHALLQRSCHPGCFDCEKRKMARRQRRQCWLDAAVKKPSEFYWRDLADFSLLSTASEHSLPSSFLRFDSKRSHMKESEELPGSVLWWTRGTVFLFFEKPTFSPISCPRYWNGNLTAHLLTLSSKPLASNTLTLVGLKDRPKWKEHLTPWKKLILSLNRPWHRGLMSGFPALNFVLSQLLTSFPLPKTVL